ncbi:unnamed protein product [Amoebophrya sp. A120]|nr:unnamed protein product [Amoebophrya sp. A120]|eukprot:GSA120T00000354001.1
MPANKKKSLSTAARVAKRQRDWEEIEEGRKKQRNADEFDPENFANRNKFTHGYHVQTSANPVLGEGEMKTVRKGTYDEGKGVCVGKVLKAGHEKATLDGDVKAAEKAKTYLAGFQKYFAQKFPSMKNQMALKMNIPEVWMCCGRADDPKGRIRTRVEKNFGGSVVLVEPFIENFMKFNSNTGATAPEALVAQALSHYSYHASNGEEVLCDLQGGKVQHEYTFSDVAINSKQEQYGAADLGALGIETFSSQHRCNHFCCPSWRKWEGAKPRLVVGLGTTGRNQAGAGLATSTGFKELEPFKILFTQQSISNHFKQAEFGGPGMLNMNKSLTLQDTAEAIAGQELHKRQIPMIRIVKDPATGSWRSLDNRRLAVFRLLQMCGKISFVRCKVETLSDDRIRQEFDSKTRENTSNGKSIQVRQTGFQIGDNVDDTRCGGLLQRLKEVKNAAAQMTDAEMQTYLQTMTGKNAEME